MIKPGLDADGLLVRLLGAHLLVTLTAALAYALLVPVVIGDASQPPGIAAFGLLGAVAAFLVLAGQALALRRCLVRVVDACNELEPPLLPDRLAVYAAPRRAAEIVALLSVVVLGSGYMPIAGPVAQGRAIATNVGAVCAVLAGLVLYAVSRAALRPLAEALRSDERTERELDERGPPVADRLGARVAIAIAVPAGAAALLATLIVSAHLVAVRNAEEDEAREVFNQALSVERRPGERDAGIAVAAEALRGAGVPVVRGLRDMQVPERAPAPPAPPLWSIPIALVVALVTAQFGRRIGRSASDDVGSAAHRMVGVGMANIRSVTMSMAHPRSEPEIRRMALALDALAATLLRMNEDQKRALTVRTEASRVRSFVLASVSHDLRGPLNSVLGFADLLLAGVEGPLSDGQRESLDALCRGGRDLLRLVDDLLDHARIDAGRMLLERAPASVDAVVERARQDVVERAKARLADDWIRMEGESGLRVEADERRLGQALGALVAFALLRPGSDGRVALRTHGEGKKVALAIRGGGTTPTREALSRMFEPFDFAPIGARAPAGLNLAVSVARGVIALHGGAVAAAPHDEGGILLLVLLPAP